MEEKVIFDLRELEVSHIKEMVENPGVYGELVTDLLNHLLELGKEYSPYGIDYNYEEETFEFNLVLKN